MPSRGSNKSIERAEKIRCVYRYTQRKWATETAQEDSIHLKHMEVIEAAAAD